MRPRSITLRFDSAILLLAGLADSAILLLAGLEVVVLIHLVINRPKLVRFS
jgi:hypothetical protein